MHGSQNSQCAHIIHLGSIWSSRTPQKPKPENRLLAQDWTGKPIIGTRLGAHDSTGKPFFRTGKPFLVSKPWQTHTRGHTENTRNRKTDYWHKIAPENRLLEQDRTGKPIIDTTWSQKTNFLATLMRKALDTSDRKPSLARAWCVAGKPKIFGFSHKPKIFGRPKIFGFSHV